MRITVGQIAQRAGLSRQTVSNILNKKGHLFRQETREAVLRASSELGYRPNAIARALRSGRFQAVALVASGRAFVGAYAPVALDGIEDALAERDLHLVVGRFEDESLTSDNAMPKNLRELLADGLIINYTHDMPRQLREVIARVQVPAVWMNVRLESDCVYPDDFQGGVLAAEHLLSLGHRRIAFFNPQHTEREICRRGRPMHYSVHERFEGYEQAMRRAGLAPWLHARPEAADEDAYRRGPFPFLDGPDRPTALVSYSTDGIGSVLTQLAANGLAMPRDLSMVAFSDGDLTFHGLPLDSVLIPHRKVGYETVSMLLDKIDRPGEEFAARIVPCELVADGHSTVRPVRTGG